ncbi:uncharacterized protein LOC119363317 [Triticum dicoccoides]|uniref:uncharacterized protein LOC119363317 n=1 Tax=Triticum dicoccoides TaxID=85692 RepID=UPI00188E90C3|nr:uncharacterized protein LOC119363317 [Triticum dicoccoides]XP_037484545.1 uncharacterized protein LOC119363317 [Triticum dicoccoides]XP_037484546.1 uncharacterized protein LOC119363317 [Triticum dicoccoides]XP_037484547.1 uncharacterized protein LOC119363317 [Triticum dicoccoides]XP_037484549.1 uncharacterized protein LOC119363317 [Triticum dicoccoides]XP_037484550.1 uncharacterized protein LOC119363317 [Triticum dicoccoides]XP_037484551.1 uncharacterized protein LOC119363317 [Triticum dic
MSTLPSSPPARPPPPAQTTISALCDDLLRKILARVPELPNLARAAFSCCAFLRDVRSDPAFRRRFRSLCPPPLLAFFLEIYMDLVLVYPSPWRPSDTGLADAFRGADFFKTRRMHGLKHVDDSGWEFDYMLGDEIQIAHRKQRASYSPLRQALSLYPDRQVLKDNSFLEFHTLSYQEDQGLQHVVCIRHDRYWARASVALFSSNTMEWQIFPWVETKALGLVPKNARSSINPGKVVDGFIYWIFPKGAGMLVLNATTSQFHRMDMPRPLSTVLFTTFKLGETKDGKLCIVHLNFEGINDGMLFVWLWGKDSDGVERWMFDKSFPLCAIVEFINCSMVIHSKVGILSVIDGFVYLSVAECRNRSNSSEWFLSFCLETSELHQLFEGPYQSHHDAHPYVMPWPPSLVYNKDGSEAKVTKNCAAEDSPVGKEKPRPILITALQSFKEALIDDDEANTTEAAAFFTIEDEKMSLMRKMATLDVRLTNARDHVLRLSADSAKLNIPCLDDDCHFCFLSQIHS